LKDSWSEAVELAKKAATQGEWQRRSVAVTKAGRGEMVCECLDKSDAEYIAHVSPSRILKWEEERKRLEQQRDDWQEDARRETCNRDYWRDRYHTAMVDLNSTISRAETAESQLSAALQRNERYKGFLLEYQSAAKSWHDCHDHEGHGCVQCDLFCEIMKRVAAALLTEAPLPEVPERDYDAHKSRSSERHYEFPEETEAPEQGHTNCLICSALVASMRRGGGRRRRST
jgi:hypothetical protein